VSWIPVGADGSLGEVSGIAYGSGSGPAVRQDGPHPHGVVADPGGRFAIVADFGADRIDVYPFPGVSEASEIPSPALSSSLYTGAGSGPRHLTFHPNLDVLYCLTEFTTELLVFGWDRESGTLSPLQEIPTDALDFDGESSAAEVSVSPDGRFVYCSNRGDHAILVYRVDQASGQLHFEDRIASAGELPWTFAFHPEKQWLSVANLGSDSVNLFRVDAGSGRLHGTQTSITVPRPASLLWVDQSAAG
jgi:6-phosphogluconolactonase